MRESVPPIKHLMSHKKPSHKDTYGRTRADEAYQTPQSQGHPRYTEHRTNPLIQAQQQMESLAGTDGKIDNFRFQSIILD